MPYCTRCGIKLPDDKEARFCPNCGAPILETQGFIKVKKDQSTSVPRVYAAGDNCSGSNYFKQLITAGSEGAIAVNSIYKALAEKT